MKAIQAEFLLEQIKVALGGSEFPSLVKQLRQLVSRAEFDPSALTLAEIQEMVRALRLFLPSLDQEIPL